MGPPLPHQGGVLAAVFSPDGKTILSAGMDGRASFWNAATGAPQGQPLLHRSWIRSAVYSPDGALVLTASDDGEARLWDATTGRPVGPAMIHPHKSEGDPFMVTEAAFSPDGNAVLSLFGDRTARVWSIARSSRKFDHLPDRLEALTGLSLDDSGVIRVLDTSAWLRRRPLLEPDR
jgi:WD40 repeat protein